jgi:hypothetical protein
MLAYLLTIPFGQRFPSLLRELMLAALLIGIAWHFVAQLRGREQRHRFRLVLPMLLFCVSTVLSIVFSAHPDLSYETSRFMPIALLFFFATQLVMDSSAAVRRLCFVMWLVVVLLGVDGFVQYLGGTSVLTGQELYGSRVTASVPHPNDLALIPILLPLAFVLPGMAVPRIARWAVWASLPLVVLTVIFSRSRNAWLGLLAWLRGRAPGSCRIPRQAGARGPHRHLARGMGDVQGCADHRPGRARLR